ncbi:type IV secretion system protein TraC [Vibrio coralliilyticus]|uniref:Type IV secretion system protein TraC n=1 Tax=Vibrio coralliilyticus TaxID=190893 RepID=A0AAP7DG39_9VIBR|nr:type IV secretion system protein TraC [Vibrio coralliilyticus]NOI31841.1 type IV secretion system protein TraC [Vibrio coralliilyticus]NOJ25285.1 type IV secretion system protein TraC [Vibrio coralliilyticus]
MFDYEFNEDESSRLFRPLAFDPDSHLFLCDDNMVGFSFVCQPASGWDTQMISTIELLLSQDPYPNCSLLSFSLLASPDIRDQLRGYDKLRLACKDALHKEVHNSAMGFMWSATREPAEIVQKTRIRNFQLLISFKMPIESLDISDSEISSIIAVQRTMEQRLLKASFVPRKVNNVMLVNIMNTVMNWQNDAEWRLTPELPVDEFKTLNEQFVQYDTKIFKARDGMVLGTEQKPTFVKMLTVRRFPRKSYAGQAFKWFGDPFEGQGCVNQNFMITVNIQYAEHSKEKEKVETKKGHYIKQSIGALTRFAPKIKEMSTDLEEVSKALSEKGKAIKITLSAAVFGDSEDDAEAGLTSLQSFMKQSGVTMVREDSFSVPSFIQLMPFGACNDAVKYSRRYFTMASNHAVPALPLFSEWKGTGTPTLQFVSRTGQLMNVCLYDSKTNYNTVIFAESGAGKSFLTNEIIRSYINTGNKVWTIDAGESYKKLSSSLGGEFTAVTPEADLSFNPWTMIDDSDPEAFFDSLEMLAGCFIAMAFTRESPSDLQHAEMERVLTQVWNKTGRNSSIDDVRAKCLEDKDQRVRDMGIQLTAFCSDGQFGKYFIKPHNVEFNGNFNVLELDGLSERPRLQAVVLFLLMVQISHSMYHEFKEDRDVKRLVIIDEAWDLLGNSKAVEEFVEKGFRRFRKYGGAGIIVTQSIMDLQNSTAGKAIAENAANTFILKQKESTISKAEKDNLMSLPDAGYRLLKKVTTEVGHYSEIFFNTNAGMGIGRLIVDPVRVMMYSTRAQDNKKIESYEKKGTPLAEALKQVAIDNNMIRFPVDRPMFLNEPYEKTVSMLDAQILKMPDRPKNNPDFVSVAANDL